MDNLGKNRESHTIMCQGVIAQIRKEQAIHIYSDYLLILTEANIYLFDNELCVH